MNKKLLVLIPSISLLASCSGFPISKNDALVIIDNIEIAVEQGIEAENFTLTTVSKSSANGVSTTDTNVHVYSPINKFYHTYRVYEYENPENKPTNSGTTVSESWKFVKEQVDEADNVNKKWIFDVTRYISQSIYTDNKQYDYIVTYELYSDEAWKLVADNYEQKYLTTPLTSALTRCKELLANEAYSTETQSFNGDSLALQAVREITEGTNQVNRYNANVYNKRLYNTYSSNTVYTSDGNESVTYQEANYKYSISDIYYPEISVTTNSQSN